MSLLFLLGTLGFLAAAVHAAGLRWSSQGRFDQLQDQP
jgi:hypothetical protein